MKEWLASIGKGLPKDPWSYCEQCYFPADVLLDTTLTIRSAWIALTSLKQRPHVTTCVEEAETLHATLLAATFKVRSRTVKTEGWFSGEVIEGSQYNAWSPEGEATTDVAAILQASHL
jgi:hypothetical protein